MKLNCSVINCPGEIIWQCTCPEKFKFCLNHLRDHSNVKKCFAENIKDKCLEFMARQYQNALNHLESDCLKLVQVMMAEIYECLKDNINCIKRKKNEIKDLILSQQTDQANDIISKANTLKVLQREKEKKQYNLSLRKLLGIDNSSLQIVTDAEKLEADLECVKKKFEEACAKIKSLEVEHKASQEKNKKLADELEPAKKSLVQEKKMLKEKNSKPRKDLQNPQENLSSAVKKNEENKDSILLEEFKSMIKLENLSRMSDKKMKNLLTQMNLQDFQRGFIEKRCYIKKIFITNDDNYIFICKANADCKN
ncbi:hypothetical protein SteCoe_37420 [Stentor coeruleus]|uniref:Uncharacterized protein n=1 Tax=Stentor coeruleus TaxID=5963 RepID=A0A1R2ANA5_9CILI|nr:hypothetical protein SteCoe_37420 [Stentor coeruleus]